MKHTDILLPKFRAFAKRCGGGQIRAVGLIESCQMCLYAHAPQGNIGKLTDAEIEEWVEWDGEPGALIAMLIDTKWIVRDAVHRLMWADWKDNAYESLKRKEREAAYKGVTFFIEPTPVSESETPHPSRSVGEPRHSVTARDGSSAESAKCRLREGKTREGMGSEGKRTKGTEEKKSEENTNKAAVGGGVRDTDLQAEAKREKAQQVANELADVRLRLQKAGAVRPSQSLASGLTEAMKANGHHKP